MMLYQQSYSLPQSIVCFCFVFLSFRRKEGADQSQLSGSMATAGGQGGGGGGGGDEGASAAQLPDPASKLLFVKVEQVLLSYTIMLACSRLNK